MAQSSTKQLDSRIDRLPRRVRRLIVVSSLLGLPGMYAWSAFWLTTSVPKIVWGPVSFVLIAATAGGALLLYLFVRDRADMRASLDERQRQLRDRAMVLCYQVLSAVVILAVALVAIAVLGLGRVVTLDGAVVGGVAISAGVLIPLLPTAALAWIEPDAPAEA
jgi:hypothetical protein